MNVRKLHDSVGGVAVGDARPRAAHSRPDGRGGMRVLIVALDAVILTEVPEASILVVAPARNSWLRHWLSDEDAARRRADARAAALTRWLERIGIQAEGRVGDPDPLLAIADVLPTFSADEIVVAARPESSDIADELVSRIRDRFAIPTVRTKASLPRAA